jgi:hypothetical protein
MSARVAHFVFVLQIPSISSHEKSFVDVMRRLEVPNTPQELQEHFLEIEQVDRGWPHRVPMERLFLN